ncbi:MAG: hypothetical protein A2Z15_04070 [Chloroflexi bacterium RBG_16_50_11]|nr:MAG: hypothetical protein A2Z15_04070 [Chloroflexi bacterium RBG_16_50_11]
MHMVKRIISEIFGFFISLPGLLLESIVLAFVLSFFFRHLTDVINEADHARIADWLIAIWKDLTGKGWYIYLITGVVVIMWALFKSRQIRQEKEVIKESQVTDEHIEKLLSIIVKKQRGTRIVRRRRIIY